MLNKQTAISDGLLFLYDKLFVVSTTAVFTTGVAPVAATAIAAARTAAFATAAASTATGWFGTIMRCSFFGCPAFEYSLAAEPDLVVLINTRHHDSNFITHIDDVFYLVNAFA
ncbi:MAG: hypothetical protein ABFD58_06595, partial [Anaerolineaceae bacterium]